MWDDEGHMSHVRKALCANGFQAFCGGCGTVGLIHTLYRNCV
nr:MAG TPA: peptidase [Caudoviricetes sp.]